MLTRYCIMLPAEGLLGPHRIVETNLPKSPGFHALDALLKPLLDGGEIEQVAVLADFDGGSDFTPLDMFVDDCSALQRLPRNEAATLHYRRASMLRMPSRDPEQLPAIYGPAILFSRRVWF